MATTANKKKQGGEITIVKKLKDYSNEPAFKKKAERAMKFLKKNGLPKSAKKTASK